MPRCYVMIEDQLGPDGSAIDLTIAVHYGTEDGRRPEGELTPAQEAAEDVANVMRAAVDNGHLQQLQKDATPQILVPGHMAGERS